MPRYKVAAPHGEVRNRRSFNPDEFAIAAERVALPVARPNRGKGAGLGSHTHRASHVAQFPGKE